MEGDQQKRRPLLIIMSHPLTTSSSSPLEQLASAFCASDESSRFIHSQAAERVDEQPQIPGRYQAIPSSVIQADDSLLSVVNPNLWTNQCHQYGFNEKSNAKGYNWSQQRNLLSLDHSKLFAVATCNSKETSLCSSVAEQESPKFSRICGTGAASSVSSGGRPSSGVKPRIKWTADLHDKFVNCVNLLGGAEKAKPRAILKLMKANGLTILHVKSHLQKYRYAKGIKESTQEKSDQRVDNDDLPMLYTNSGMQVKAILQMQLEVQRHLFEQLEIQQNLLQAIGEQGKRIKMMRDELIKANK